MNRRLILALLTIALGFLSTANAADLAQTTSNVRVEHLGSALSLNFDLGNLAKEQVVKNGVSCDQYSIPMEGTTYDYGRPMLPAVSRFVVVPPDAGLELEVTADTPRELRAVATPALCDDSLLTYKNLPAIQGTYPGKLAEMSEPFVIRGARLVKVTVYPIQYDPSNNSYQQYPNIQTSIRFTDGEAINPVAYPVRKWRSKAFMNALAAMAANPEDLTRDDPQDTEPPYVGHYLVTAHQATIPWIRDYIEFRRKTGYQMDIYDVPSGDAGNTQTVRNGIQHRYDAYLQAGTDPFDELMIVGDEQYDAPGAYAAQNLLPPEAGQSIWGGGYPHADFKFACLEGGGNDLHPDVGYSRMPAGSQGAAALIFGRTMAYEDTPYVANTDWFTRGGVYSAHWGNGADEAWHISIHTNVRYGEEVLKSLGFNHIWFYENTAYDQEAAQLAGPISAAYNGGVNVLIGRAELYCWRSSCSLSPNHVFPMDICYSGHGEWAMQNLYRSGSYPNSMFGPVTRTASWGWPATMPINYIWLSMVNGVLQRDLPLGMARMLAVNSIENIFPDFSVYAGVNLYIHIKTDTDCFGDPGIQPWIGVPRMAEVTVPQSIPASTKMLEVFVHAQNSQNPMPGAQVTFYAPGNMPAVNDPEHYAAYTSFMMKTTKSDSSGIARFVLDDNQQLVNNTPLYVSVSGRDIRPFTAQINIAEQPSALGLGDWSLNEQVGNGDDAVNPGETFDLNLVARNTGNQDALQEVTATVESLSPYLEVVNGGEVSFGDLDAGADAQGNMPITIHFSAATPDGASRPITQPILAVDFASGDNHWRTGIKFNPVAPNLELVSIVGGNIIAMGQSDLTLDIGNRGRLDSPGLNVELVSLGMGVTVVAGSSTLSSLAENQHARIDQPFTVSGDSLVVPGFRTPMAAIFTDGGDDIDSAYFVLQVMSERANAPTGPDKYGYICFDDGDTDWELAPHYRWFEINREVQDYDFEGTRLDSLEGQTEFDIGKCLAVPLGFTTQFYGHDYDTITIATNGFVSLGNQPRITNYCNWPMDKAMGGGAGMIAPYWDDLRFGQNGHIFAYHDEDSSRFIVEWYRMVPASGNAELTFELVILDKQYNPWIRESGDPNVLVQYKTISALADIRNGDQEWVSNIAYGSVGISSPTGQTGINYYYNNHYAVSAGALQARRALFYTTSLRYRPCTLFGHVGDAWTGVPIEGVRIKTQHGFEAITDADGNWRIENALAEVKFYITAHKEFYNDSTLTDFAVGENGEQEINFDLLHPEFIPSTVQIEAWMDPGLRIDMPFHLYNGGNGPLTWSVQKRLLGDANAQPWELRRSFAVTDSTLDTRIEGVAFANEKYYVCGGNGTAEDVPNMMYVLDRNGSLVNSYQQCGNSAVGFKDLEWDGSLLWGSGERTVYGFTPDDGQVSYSWPGPNATNSAIVWDPDDGILWVAGTVTNIYAYDVDGNALGRTLNRKGLSFSALTYWPDDPDGYKLYIVNQPGGEDFTRIYKMNIETGDTMLVRSLPHREGSTGRNGACITNKFDVYSWVMMAIDNIAPASGGDQLEVYQLDALRDWYNLDVWGGVLNADSTQDFVLSLNSTGLPDTLFESELRFSHNAANIDSIISVKLHVIGPLPPETFPLISPANEDTVTALPLLHDSLKVPAILFKWDPSHDPNHADIAHYRLHFEVNNQTAVVPAADTALAVILDSLRLPVWFDMPVTWWVEAISGQDTVECQQRFRFHIRPDAADMEKYGQPVEFGLSSIYPSPFNAVTRIKFGADRAVRTTLKAYDVLGREAAILFDQVPQVGYYQVAWDAGRLASGVYVLRLESAGRSKIQKVALIR